MCSHPRSTLLALARSLLAAFLLAGVPAVQAWPVQTLADAHHTAWSYAAGAPADVWTLAQAADGHLWLGTGSGLHRFDGVRFEPVPLAAGESLPSHNITALTLTPQGTAWLGFYAAGVARLHEGRVQQHGVAEGLPEGMVYRIVVATDGTVWAALDGGLARWQGGRWQTLGAAEGYPWTHADWLLLDRAGDLWVSNGSTLVVLPQGESRFRATGQSTTLHAVMAQAPDGAIWVSDALGTRVVHGLSTAIHTALPELQAKRLLVHPDGSLWGTDARQGGVFRVPARPAGNVIIERFGPVQGLSAEVAVPLLIDREDTLWVGTNLGLDRFRANRVQTVAAIRDSAPQGYGLAVGAAEVAVASGGVLYTLDANSQVTQPRLDGLPRILAAQIDPAGTLWLVGYDTLLRVRGDVPEPVPLPGHRMGRAIRALHADAQGLWVSINGQGLYRLEQDQWLPQPLQDHRVPLAITSNAAGTWLGYAQNRVEWRAGAALEVYTEADGLAVGNVTALCVDGPYVWVAGEKGLAWRSNGRFHTLAHAREPALSGVSGIQVVGDSLWLNGQRGVVHVQRDALLASAHQAGPLLGLRVFDALDGVPGIALQASPVSTLQVGREHRLWVATNQGVAWLDTRALPTNPHPPQVQIRAVVADDQQLGTQAPLHLPAHTGNLRIDYSATSLRLPERVRFRYQLLDLDPDWVDAGTRRSAFYAHPPPGDYRFRVLASNEDGVPSTTTAEIEFRVRAAVYQTGWFAALCVLAGAGVLWVGYGLRMRALGRSIRARLHERHLERERIARELHDTLLQSIQGLTLRFQATAHRLPADSPAREDMERVLSLADAVIAEGRDRVVDIRAASSEGDELSTALHKVALELGEEHPATLDWSTTGVERPLDPIVRDELYRMGREALINAYRHADADRIDVSLAYQRDALILRISDDGRGIDAAVLQAGRPGHWGLIGMRERAARIGARLQMHSTPDKGTIIQIHIAARIAYGQRPVQPRRRWWRRKGLAETPE